MVSLSFLGRIAGGSAGDWQLFTAGKMAVILSRAKRSASACRCGEIRRCAQDDDDF